MASRSTQMEWSGESQSRDRSMYFVCGGMHGRFLLKALLVRLGTVD